MARRFRAETLLLGGGLVLLAASVVAALLAPSGLTPALAAMGIALGTLGVLQSGRLSRVQWAFALAPLTPCLVGAALFDPPALAIVLAPFAYWSSVILGIPAFFVMRRRGWLHAWQVVCAGGFVGAVVGMVVVAPGFQISSLLLGAGYGAATGLVFWVIAFSPWFGSLARTE